MYMFIDFWEFIHHSNGIIDKREIRIDEIAIDIMRQSGNFIDDVQQRCDSNRIFTLAFIFDKPHNCLSQIYWIRSISNALFVGSMCKCIAPLIIQNKHTYRHILFLIMSPNHRQSSNTSQEYTSFAKTFSNDSLVMNDIEK